MRTFISLTTICCVLSLASLPRTSCAGTNLVANASQGSGANWTQNIWKTNNGTGTGVGTAVAPVAGNTYTYLPIATPFGNNLGNARTRNPITNATALITFPGDSLTMTTNTEIRTKNITTPATLVPVLNFPGTNGNPGLILAGGVLNVGDDGVPGITGLVQVVSTSFICPGDNGAGTTARPARAFTIAGQLTGSGSLVILQTPTNLAQTISSTNNTYSGQWLVKAGRLLGAAPGSLGTNSSFVIDPLVLPPPPMNPTVAATNAWFNGPAVLEANYTLNSAGTLTLTNGGIMRLHQSTVFTAATIEGTSLSPGTHYYTELITNFPNNFDPGGYGAITVQPYGTPPPLPPTILAQPLNQLPYSGRTARFTVTAVDNGFPPLTYQWIRGGTNILNGGNISGATNSILVITNASAADVGTYQVLVANSIASKLSSVATLGVQPLGGELYATSMLAANPVAFYQLNETADPATGTAGVFDYIGGYSGVYGSQVQNGNPNYNIAGPRPTDGFPGFLQGNTAAQFANTQPGSYISAIPLNLNTNTVTIMAWINPNGVQAYNNGLVYCRGGNTVVGLGYNNVGVLNYNWNNEEPTYAWDSGLIPPSGQWSMVALVVSPTNATMYMLNTSGLAASAHPYTHVVQGFEGNTVIGDDPYDVTAGTPGARAFTGIIDDVAIFNSALTQDQLLSLYLAASGIPSYPPYVAIPPVSQTVYQGQTVQFTGLAVGTSPLTYQWQSAVSGSGVYTDIHDGGQFSGSITPTLTITGVGPQNQRDYIVHVSNNSGIITSPDPASLPPATLTVLSTSAAQNITMTNQEATGADWDIGGTTPGSNTNWSDANPASISAVAEPGSTYEILPGARLRSPVNPTVATFPGNVLTVDGDGVWNVNPGAGATIAEIRFKQPTYGLVNGTVIFPRLRMNGGQLDSGNDGTIILGGEVDILANTPINNDSGNDRGYRLDAWLTGSGSVEYHGYNQTTFMPAYTNSLNLTCNTNTFSGPWSVVTGTLLGTGTNSLGTNTIVVAANGALETTYDIKSTNATLALSGRMYLHQNDTFKSVLVNGVALAPGSNSWATLNAAYPTNFPANWTPQAGAAGFSTASGSITVLAYSGPIISKQPQSQTLWGQQNAQFNVSAIGNLPLVYRWQAGPSGSGVFANLSDGGNVAGSTNATLNITNVTTTNGLDYRVTITNIYGAVTSSVATLTVRPGPTITLEPVSQQTLYQQQSFVLTAYAIGVPPLSYQWQAGAYGSGVYQNVNNGGTISGATTTNLTISSVDFVNGLDYILIVRNAGGSVTSSVATLTVQAISPPQDLTLDYGGTPIQQPQGASWDTVNNWSDGLAASVSAVEKPGSTYEVVTGARLRSLTNTPYVTFPGLKLTVDGSGIWVNNNDSTIGEIRFKHPVTPATNYFKDLVMNGGQLDNGDNGLIVIEGEMEILTNTPIYVDSSAGQDRGYQIHSWLTGSGGIEWHQFSAALGGASLNIAGTSNTFSGPLHVVQGALVGSGVNSLGTNSITVDSTGALETTYDLHNNAATLTLNGQMFLHQNDTFWNVTVAGTALGPGTHSFASLTAAFPANFPASWAQQDGSTVSTGSGSLTVLGAPPGYLSFSFSGGSLQLSWSPGTLLEATNILGPWVTNNAASPYTVVPTARQKYYRVQLQ